MPVRLTNALMVQNGQVIRGDLLLSGSHIKEVFEETPQGPVLPGRSEDYPQDNTQVIDAQDALLLPGIIDDQVHFREPGQPHKGTIATESRAALLGGVTTFMDMPNNSPAITTAEALQQKYALAARQSYANYAFYIGATNQNAAEIVHTPAPCCGIKVFMGSSTGNMLVNDPQALEVIFRDYKGIVAVHSEDETLIQQQLSLAKAQYGEDIPVALHPVIRSRQACIQSTKRALALAEKHGTRLHLLHLSTEEEVELVARSRQRAPQITAEVCVPHLWYCDQDYATYGTRIKCNPAIKTAADRTALRQAVKQNIIQVIATDHAPHTLEEKQRPYTQAPSGMPSVQHSLLMMAQLVTQGVFTWPELVRAMCHQPAQIFELPQRGFLQPGFLADAVLLRPHTPCTVTQEDLAYTCGWSPLEGHTFPLSIDAVWVNGTQAVSGGKLLTRPDVHAAK